MAGPLFLEKDMAGRRHFGWAKWGVPPAHCSCPRAPERRGQAKPTIPKRGQYIHGEPNRPPSQLLSCPQCTTQRVTAPAVERVGPEQPVWPESSKVKVLFCLLGLANGFRDRETHLVSLACRCLSKLMAWKDWGRTWKGNNKNSSSRCSLTNSA